MASAADDETTGVTGASLYSHLPIAVRSQWYAVAFGDELPNAASGKVGMKAPLPLAVSLLGDPLVLWRDKLGIARCVADKCPHRSAPLSLGRVNGATGTIECIYHGWQMDGHSGKVTEIPALLDGKPIPTNAKVRTYPVHEQDGVVYVWPGPPEEAELAEKPSRDLTDEGQLLVDHKSGFVVQRVCLDLPIDHSLMVENLLDPAHIPFAHEGTIGKRNQAKPLKMIVNKTKCGIRGVTRDGYYNGFEAPCTIVLHTPPVPGKMDMYQYVACTPSAPGHMRMVYRAYRNFATWADYIPPLRWVLNSLTMKIIFQDYNLLLGQQMRLRERALPWNSTIQVDVLPLAYRRYWNKTFGNLTSSGPWWRGWDGNLDVEDLERLGAWDRDFDCNGCAVPKRPHHPKNVLEVSGTPYTAIRPQLPANTWWRSIAVSIAVVSTTVMVCGRWRAKCSPPR